MAQSCDIDCRSVPTTPVYAARWIENHLLDKFQQEKSYYANAETAND